MKYRGYISNVLSCATHIGMGDDFENRSLIGILPHFQILQHFNIQLIFLNGCNISLFKMFEGSTKSHHCSRMSFATP